MTWDPHCFYERLSAHLFERRTAGEVSISLTGTEPDYSTCRRPVEPPRRRRLKLVSYLELPR